ncbi:MAG: glycosyltransferase family 1 protein [Actinomycetota bacterium]|nr:glycosyltransferase family 1 protein [Actinomycetota bacterium]MEE2958345.1 glycosyltransferase family 1 protein [Actinomycetota bacterium]
MTGRLRIAYLLEQPWHRVPGGTAVAAVRTAEALVGRDDVDLVGLTAHHSGLPADGFPVAPPSELPLVASRLPRALLYESWHRFSRPRVESLISDVDLVHASGGAVPPTRRPLVATVHDLAWRRHPEVATSRGRRLFEAWLTDARRAEVVACPSEATLRDLVAAGFDEDRLHVVPLGVGPAKVVLPGAREAVRSVLRRHCVDGSFVLWIGTVEPRKNLPGLVAAMDRIPGGGSIPLVLIGPTGWEADACRITAPLGDRAVLVGPVPEPERDAWLEAASVLCLPSLQEGFGLPVLEAMAAGTPVVTSSGTATEEVAAGAALVADPTDAGAVGEALGAVLSDGVLADRLAAAGLERAAAFTWKATAEATVLVYREAVARWGG